jgi:ABC-2 type transport system permease protein
VPAIRGAFIPLVVTPLVYRAFYPQPYLNQIMRKIPIAIVDNDLSELSRRIVQTLDASGAVKVVVRADTLPQARVSLDLPALARAELRQSNLSYAALTGCTATYAHASLPPRRRALRRAGHKR